MTRNYRRPYIKAALGKMNTQAVIKSIGEARCPRSTPIAIVAFHDIGLITQAEDTTESKPSGYLWL